MPKEIPIQLKASDVGRVLEVASDLYSRKESIIRELVQNAFDAYALNCKITIDYDNEVLIVEDDGVGMDYYIISNYLTDFGMSSKTKKAPALKPTWKLKRKRRYIGHKGIGFFSVFALGNKVVVETYPVNENVGYRIEIRRVGFNKFTAKAQQILKLKPHGTTVIVSEWTEKTTFDRALLRDYIGILPLEFEDFNIHLKEIQDGKVKFEEKHFRYIFPDGKLYSFSSKNISFKIVFISEEASKYVVFTPFKLSVNYMIIGDLSNAFNTFYNLPSRSRITGYININFYEWDFTKYGDYLDAGRERLNSKCISTIKEYIKNLPDFNKFIDRISKTFAKIMRDEDVDHNYLIYPILIYYVFDLYNAWSGAVNRQIEDLVDEIISRTKFSTVKGYISFKSTSEIIYLIHEKQIYEYNPHNEEQTNIAQRVADKGIKVRKKPKTYIDSFYPINKIPSIIEAPPELLYNTLYSEENKKLASDIEDKNLRDAIEKAFEDVFKETEKSFENANDRYRTERRDVIMPSDVKREYIDEKEQLESAESTEAKKEEKRDIIYVYEHKSNKVIKTMLSKYRILKDHIKKLYIHICGVLQTLYITPAKVEDKNVVALTVYIPEDVAERKGIPYGRYIFINTNNDEVKTILGIKDDLTRKLLLLDILAHELTHLIYPQHNDDFIEFYNTLKLKMQLRYIAKVTLAH